MAVIRIKNKVDGGGIPSGLTQGELAVNLSDRSLYVGGTVGNSIFISGVQSFNGATGAVTGASLGANTFTGLNQFGAGISAAGATIGTLIVHNGISASGGATFNGVIRAVSGITTANLYVSTGATFASTLQVNGGFSAANTSTFGGLAYFNSGISASGATLGRLTVHNGISANGGATFSGLVHAVSGISAAGATLGTLIVHNGISASGGITFKNDVYIGGVLNMSGQQVVSTYGQTADLPSYEEGARAGDLAFVNGNDATPQGAGIGYYYFRENVQYTTSSGGTTTGNRWVEVGNAVTRYDANGDGVIDGLDLASVLGAWGAISSPEYATGTQFGIRDGITGAFEVKVYGISTGKKASAFKITSDEAEPYISFQANETNFNSRVIITDSSGEPALHVQTGRSLFSEGVEFQAGFSAGCVGGGITFNCLTHFTQGLSASGATLGTLVVNGGATFNGLVHMGATLTMNSNIRFNSGYGISGGFIDAGWY